MAEDQSTWSMAERWPSVGGSTPYYTSFEFNPSTLGQNTDGWEIEGFI